MLDAEMAAFVAETEAMYPPDVAEMGVAAQRALYDRMAAHFRGPRPAGLAVLDGAIAGSAGAVPVRRYTPSGRAMGGARVVYFHGGGFALGGLESHDDVCAEMAARAGIPVISVDYRLAPEHLHPAAYEDGLAAARAVASEGPIVLAGDSVGGGLAAAAALALRGDPAVQVLGQVLIYPSLGGEALDLPAYREQAVAPLLSAADLRAYQSLRAGGAPDWADPRFAPLSAPEVDGIAPVAAFSVALDPLRDDAPAWAGRLQAVGVPAACDVAPGLCHGCLRARRMSRRAADFFHRICDAVAEFAQI